MAKRGHGEEEILSGVAGDGGRGLPQAWDQPATFLPVEEEVLRGWHCRSCDSCGAMITRS